MDFQKQLAAARVILACIEKHAPRDRDGVLMPPYKKWAAELQAQIDKALEWQKNANPLKEEAHADNPSQ
ncbi:MAG: hypothetical protein A2Y74_01575 [Actinobacteria bacterium RBG_13_63_9]|nr:MAG: hypothetical protein A2Y74_01575 [Actinobacteria bacterium RBG_13_63_9]